MYLQLDTKFNPFTYDEMVKPLIHYKEAHDEVEAAYSDLAQQTEVWGNIDPINSPIAYGKYQGYSEELDRAVDDFSRGMTARNSGALLELKRRYARDIAPIAVAAEEMKKANELRASDPDAIWEVDEYDSLDYFLSGRTANNRHQSYDALVKKTAAITEAVMAAALKKDPELRAVLGGTYQELIQHTGASSQELEGALRQVLDSEPDKNNLLATIKYEVARGTGWEDYEQRGQKRINSALNTGLYAGLDRPIRQLMANYNYGVQGQGTRTGQGVKRNTRATGDGTETNNTWQLPTSTFVLPYTKGSMGVSENDWRSGDTVFGDKPAKGAFLTTWAELPGIARSFLKKYLGSVNPDQYMFYFMNVYNPGEWTEKPYYYLHVAPKASGNSPKVETVDSVVDMDQYTTDTTTN